MSMLDDAALRLFPRPKKRGPVEAITFKLPALLRQNCFRALKSAAPLKLALGYLFLLALLSFRALKSAAPLKHPALAGDCSSS